MVKEKKYFADVAVPPGKTINDFLKANNMTQTELAKRMGMSKKHINQLVKGKTTITPDTAIKLEKVFSPMADFWLNLEANFRTAQARLNGNLKKEEKEIAEKIPYSKMASFGWVKKADNLADKVDNLRNFFRVSSLNSIDSVYGATFRTSKQDKVSPWALAAWLERGESLVREKEISPFSSDKLKSCLPQLRNLTQKEPMDFYEDLVNKLADCGIAFVLVPFLPKTYAQGAVKWLSPKLVMVQMSLRYKFANIFWFSFFHEIGHILLHGKKETYIEFDLEDREEIEDEADEFAAKTLIPEEKFNYFLQQKDFSENAIIRFAGDLGIDPGIVVGRLQYEGIIDYSIFNGLKKKYNWVQFPQM